MKKTLWFDPTIKPVRPGVYERKMPFRGPSFSFWNGRYWGLSCALVSEAVNAATVKSGYQFQDWRGVLK